MASKLAFISVLAALILVGVVHVTSEPGATAEEFKHFMRGFLERRSESCVKECEMDCENDDYKCCEFKDTGRNGKCRLVSTYPNYRYMCIHPDYEYVSAHEVLHDDCGLKSK